LNYGNSRDRRMMALAAIKIRINNKEKLEISERMLE